MFKQNPSKHPYAKKSSRKQQWHLLSPQLPHQKPSPQPALFQSGQIPRLPKRDSSISERGEGGKWGNKVLTTDESNNLTDSRIQDSAFLSEKRLPNQEYFHQPLVFRDKKKRKDPGANNRPARHNKIEGLPAQLSQMKQLTLSHEKELKQLRSSLSQKELHRLMKIQSVEKLKLVESICVNKGDPLKRSKRF